MLHCLFYQTPGIHIVMYCFYSGFIDSTFLRICAVPRIANLTKVVDVMGSWDFSNIALDVSINYSSCTYDDWYDFYFLIPHPLALNLEISVLNYLLSCLCHLATSMITHLLVSFKSRLLHGIYLSVMSGESYRLVTSSFSTTCSGLCWYQCWASTAML